MSASADEVARNDVVHSKVIDHAAVR